MTQQHKGERPQEIKYKGDRYILGLHGVPSRYAGSELDDPKNWYWKVGTKKDDNYFLPAWDESLYGDLPTN